MNNKYSHMIISVIIIGLCLFYAFIGVSLSELRDALKSVRYIYLFPALTLVAFSYFLRAMRWRYLIRSVKNVKTKDLFSPLMVGFMGNMIPARAGEFIRAYLLSKKENISFSASFATIFIERLFDLIILLFLLVAVLLFMPEVLSAGGTYQIADKVKMFAAVSFSLCLFIFLFSALLQFKNDWAMKIVNICITPFPKRWGEKITILVTCFTEGLKILRDKRGFLATIILSFLIWSIFILIYYPLYFAFNIETQLPVLSSITVLCLTVKIFITIAPTPGFLGSYHLACVTVLHGIFGIQKAIALSYGIVAWFVVMGFTIMVGILYAVKENISYAQIEASRQRT